MSLLYSGLKDAFHEFTNGGAEIQIQGEVGASSKLWSVLMGLGLVLVPVQAYINPEDRPGKESTVESVEPHVDRVRRAHLNDMETILPFFTMGLIYICTDPGAISAMVLIRILAVARIVHTLVYAFGPVPQPSRAIAFIVGFSITIYMGVYTLCRTIKFI